MQRTCVILFTLLMVSFLAHGQERWLQPSKFFYHPGEPIAIDFREGVDFIGEDWQIPGKPETYKDHVEKATLHQPDKVTDIHSFIGGGDAHLAIPPQGEGALMVVVETRNAYRELAAEKFNDYLKEAALDEAYGHRKKMNALEKPGSELFAHFMKLLLQVGEKTDDTFKKEAGLTVEIIPLQNPYTLKVGDRVQFKVMYEGKPAFGARVKVWNHYQHRTSVQNIFSEQNGVIETHISNPGRWMVSFVKMVPSDDPRSDWQSYKSSLVFEVR